MVYNKVRIFEKTRKREDKIARFGLLRSRKKNKKVVKLKIKL